MLPSGITTTSRWISRLPPFARRALQVDQMELDSALSQMYSLCVRPSLVTKMSKARKMTKNHYYRDDPAFLVLQIVFIIVTDIAYGCAVSTSASLFFTNLLYDILFNFLVLGILFATVTWVVVNRFLMGNVYINEIRREVDWQYSFDVHCNGYFTFFMWTRVFQYVLLPLIVENVLQQRLIANGLYAIGCTTYVYNVFVGYLELPSLAYQQKLMYPIPAIILCFLFFTFVSNTNLTQSSVLSTWQS